jgi:hypothetical protein
MDGAIIIAVAYVGWLVHTQPDVLTNHLFHWLCPWLDDDDQS